MIRQAQAVVLGQSVQEAAEVEKTDFAELSGSLNIADGLISNNDLVMKSPLLRLDGQGQASLPSEQIDYLITAKVVGSIEGQGGLDQLKGLPIPIRIAGTFKEPSFGVDTKELARLLVTGTAGQAAHTGSSCRTSARPSGSSVQPGFWLPRRAASSANQVSLSRYGALS